MEAVLGGVVPRRRFAGAALGVALLASAGGVRPARAAEVSPPRVSVEGRSLLVSIDLLSAFDDGVRERIESGLATSFDYDFELLRDRKRWFDAEILAARLQVTAMYNALTRDYLVNFKLDGRLIESRLVRDFAALETAMTRVDRLAVFPVEPAPRGPRLLVRARALLDGRSRTLFWTSRESTAWRESAKFRVPRPAG